MHSDPIPSQTLEHFREVAEQNLSDALVLIKDGQVVLHYQRPGTDPRFEIMSVTKAIASLVFGQLVDRGLVHLDDKLSRFYPQWAGDPRGDITVRHVLEHTSGLADKKGSEDIYASGDFIGFALDAKLEAQPGTRFFYSNSASNLLSGIVRTVSGRELDLASQDFFSRLGISDATWSADNAGHTSVNSGLVLTVDDLAKIGQLVLDEGEWCGQQIVSRDWLETSTRTFHTPQLMGSANGFFWWLKPKSVKIGFDKDLFDAWSRTGMPSEIIDKFRPLDGQFFDRKDYFQTVLRTMTGKQDSKDIDRDLAGWYQATWKSGRPDGSMRPSGIASIRADGWLGQFLLVYPEERLVVVRLRHPPQDTTQNDAGAFKEIEKEIDKLVPPPKSP